MNLVNPDDIARALAPLLDSMEKRVSFAVNEALQSAIDRLHGIQVKISVDVPPRATPVN